ncbi:uncharacterized protein LOC128814646 isoform X2 [Vidua macroura]|uniref:uncharacterized protein LOC128814646 isoform X2 n=1 Tax=Vidua macroura TaxID=187451 RepID=UPI0023A81943|nr:uncharacterized protein LOC128814646 isoform X2 [Vidua macroura]
MLPTKPPPRAALEDAVEPRQSPGTRQEPADPRNAARPPGPEEPIPSRDAQPAVKDPSPTNSPPWPEAPEECPARPSTLDLCSSLRKQQWGTDWAAVKENGVEATPATGTATASSEERWALQSELGKCIEEFRRIRIPATFPNKKRQWQSELLRKYQL